MDVCRFLKILWRFENNHSVSYWTWVVQSSPCWSALYCCLIEEAFLTSNVMFMRGKCSAKWSLSLVDSTDNFHLVVFSCWKPTIEANEEAFNFRFAVSPKAVFIKVYSQERGGNWLLNCLCSQIRILFFWKFSWNFFVVLCGSIF